MLNYHLFICLDEYYHEEIYFLHFYNDVLLEVQEWIFCEHPCEYVLYIMISQPTEVHSYQDVI